MSASAALIFTASAAIVYAAVRRAIVAGRVIDAFVMRNMGRISRRDTMDLYGRLSARLILAFWLDSVPAMYSSLLRSLGGRGYR